MQTLTFQVPDTIELDVRDTIKFLAAKMYESGKLSLGQAAALAGFSKIAFAEILSEYDVSLINYSIADIQKDAAAI